jgi:hypothetical protein
VEQLRLAQELQELKDRKRELELRQREVRGQHSAISSEVAAAMEGGLQAGKVNVAEIEAQLCQQQARYVGL